MQRRKIFTQGRYATVASTLALFLALGGTAYAINTVDTFDIVNDTVQSVDIKNDTISTLDVHDETLIGANVLDGSLRGADIANNSIGAADLDFGVAVPKNWASINGATGGSLGAFNLLASDRLGTGNYLLTFLNNIDQCAWLSTAVNRAHAPDVDAGVVTLTRVNGSTVRVSTTVGGVARDMDFSIGILC